jgi:mono/diheme cytochrome c family protein
MRTSLLHDSTALVLMLFFAFATPWVLAGEENSMNMDHDHVHHHHAIFAKIPENARVQPNPLWNDPDAITAGKKLFAQHCAECHGVNAEGVRRKAPNLRKDEVQAATAGSIFWILSNGIVRHGMPDWSKLPEAQRWQITTYIKSMPPIGSVTMDPASSASKEHTEQ